MIYELVILKAISADLPAIIELHAQLDGEKPLSYDEADRIFSKFQQYPNYSLYIAKIRNRIIGTFELLIMDNLAHKGAPSGIVEDVVVDKDHRSSGIGRKMMEYAIDVCRQNGCYKLSLSSNINRKKAHAFYEKLGFKRHGFSFLIELIQV